MPQISSYVLTYGSDVFADLEASPFDLVITEGAPQDGFPSISDAELALLQAQGRTVVGYINAAVVDDTRPYWDAAWTDDGTDLGDTTAQAPDWLADQPANAFGLYARFWDPEWRALVVGQAVDLVNRGYDGVFIDDILAYYELAQVAGQPSATDLAAAMMELVLAVDTAIRAVNPDAYLVVNGGPYIMGDAGPANSALATAYRNAVDAILLENQTPAVWDYARTTFPAATEVLALSSWGDPDAFAIDAWQHGLIPYAAPDGDYQAVGPFIGPQSSLDDHLIGGDGPNEFHGGDGDDHLEGRGGDDHLYGDAGNDRLEGGTGSDWLEGGSGNDLLISTGATVVDTDANAGDLFEVRGGDTLLGGGGDDEIRVGYDSFANGGAGHDRAVIDLLGGRDDQPCGRDRDGRRCDRRHAHQHRESHRLGPCRQPDGRQQRRCAGRRRRG